MTEACLLLFFLKAAGPVRVEPVAVQSALAVLARDLVALVVSSRFNRCGSALRSLAKVRVMLAGVDSVGIGINPVEGWNSWMILFFVGVIVVGVSTSFFP